MTPKAWKRLFFRIILWMGLLLGGILLATLAFATWRIYTKEREAKTAHMDEAHALSELSARKATLTEDLKNLDTSRGVEAEVRKRYPVAKPGEETILLIAPKPVAKATSTPEAGLWEHLFGWLPW